ncbi:uncharacterized protein LOC141572848 [Rhinolophus sinicus]|uniref:uncharacterized protein LOC141572848 n=1 Tax=Rhinolophus sinicus TaxID=89399 RepID=UPI003D797A44
MVWISHQPLRHVLRADTRGRCGLAVILARGSGDRQPRTEARLLFAARTCGARRLPGGTGLGREDPAGVFTNRWSPGGPPREGRPPPGSTQPYPSPLYDSVAVETGGVAASLPAQPSAQGRARRTPSPARIRANDRAGGGPIARVAEAETGRVHALPAASSPQEHSSLVSHHPESRPHILDTTLVHTASSDPDLPQALSVGSMVCAHPPYAGLCSRIPRQGRDPPNPGLYARQRPEGWIPGSRTSAPRPVVCRHSPVIQRVPQSAPCFRIPHPALWRSPGSQP